ncbi:MULTISPECIES: DUF6627 family protein [Thiomicrorhabdus]|uniref:PA2779 family protein n=1 Tax=Thiomicrorhabdus heinhorstiae TaxID=2748010 RepID=A0ABS0BX57_9GAMM|nr:MULTISPECIES: DUF6627 family protein [Thiomicrorhabdus]MBF6057426.1 PA2779 family protein [Thiomicrorhabdus heinhorstiae]
MKLSRRFTKLVSVLSLFAFLNGYVGYAYAGMVTNDQITAQANHDLTVQQILGALDRDDVQEQLVALGVNPDDAKARVSQMNDQELVALNQKLDELPAGSGVLEVLLLVFVVLVITDMLGATDVFPFVNNINK